MGERAVGPATLRRGHGPARRSRSVGRSQRAARELQEGGLFDQSSDELRDQVKLELEDLLVEAEDIAGSQSQQAAGIAGRVLDAMEQAELPEDEDPVDPVPIWRHPDLDEDARRSCLELELVTSMARALGWKYGQSERGSPRTTWLVEQAQEVFTQVDSFSAADEWLADPPAVPEGLSGVPRLAR